ncbi:MAG TPA: glycosyltransferase [Dehalococcoidia bacterium]
MRVLIVTNMYPTPDRPHFGIFVQEQAESLRRLGVEVDVLFMDGRASKLNYLKAFPRLWKRLREREYDVIHAHYIFAGIVARAQRRRPVVLTHHGPEVFMTWEKYLCRLFTRWFDSVIVVSEEMRRRLKVPYAHVIPCGIDMEKFRPAPQEECRRALGLPLDKRLVLWAGELQRPEKRFELITQAMELLKARRPDVELVVLSGKPYHWVPRYMNACDVLALTSDAEGSPMVVKEAMACAIPVVATPVGDVEEVIGGTAGCYVTSQDPAEIARKLELALAHGGRTTGREDVAAMDLDAIGRRVLEVYRRTLASWRGGRRRGTEAPAVEPEGANG